jgi:hypothetical protein
MGTIEKLLNYAPFVNPLTVKKSGKMARRDVVRDRRLVNAKARKRNALTIIK